jgi:uncharacterized protein YijF (DUF1287 family)
MTQNLPVAACIATVTLHLPSIAQSAASIQARLALPQLNHSPISSVCHFSRPMALAVLIARSHIGNLLMVDSHYQSLDFESEKMQTSVGLVPECVVLSLRNEFVVKVIQFWLCPSRLG